MDSIQIKRKPN